MGLLLELLDFGFWKGDFWICDVEGGSLFWGLGSVGGVSEL